MFGREAVEALASLTTIQRRIPLAKGWLAAHFYAEGWSVARFARTLRISDVAVRGYLRREAENRERLRADAERIERSRRAAQEAKGGEVGLASNQHRSAEWSANPHYQSGT